MFELAAGDRVGEEGKSQPWAGVCHVGYGSVILMFHSGVPDLPYLS